MSNSTPTKTIALLIVAAALLAAPAAAETTIVNINTDQKIAGINPNIYGHFTEHLGHCIYDGIWVGPDSDIPNVRGIRTDVVEALKKIKPPVIRWPGGCFADSYHWRDGIGPREKRPKTVNVHWGRVVEDNSFGNDEFFDFCKQVGAAPMIAANVGSGTPAELRDWLEYLNFKGDSTLADMRRQNGNPKTFDLRYLCIGNENWGCGGSMSPSQYAKLYRVFSEYCHYPPPEGFYRVACGPSDDNYTWTREFFAELTGRATHGRDRMNRIEAFDLHYYSSAQAYGTATEYTTEQFYGLLAKCLRIEPIMLKHWQIMEEYDPGHSVKLGICEWGTWHQPMPGTNKSFLRQQNSVRDALVAALTLNIFNNHCEKIGIANIAQTVNVLQAMILTDGPKMLLTPTYHVFEMYVPHQGAAGLTCDVVTTDIKSGDESIPRVTVSASIKEDIMTVTLVNTHATEETIVELRFDDPERKSMNSWQVLAADNIKAHNTFEDPEKVKPKTVKGTASLMKAFVLPPASVNLITYSAR